MRKSLLLLASFAGLVACFGEKKSAEGQEGQTTEEACPAAAPAEATAPAGEPAAAPAAEPAAEHTAEHAEHHNKK